MTDRKKEPTEEEITRMREMAVTELRLSPEGYPINEKGQRICGARRHNRWGIEGYCQSTLLFPNGRCRMHGGMSSFGRNSGRYKTGKYSKVLPKSLLDLYEQSLTDEDLLTLKEEIALLDAMLMEQLENYGYTYASDRWQRIREVYENMKRAQQNDDWRRVQQGMDDLARLIEEGVSDAAARAEVLELIERRRRLVETEHRMMMNMGLMLSTTQVMKLLSVVVQIIEEHVPDSKIRNRIAYAIRSRVLTQAERSADGWREQESRALPEP